MTIYDIAKITGYSSATVARALSGNGYCSKKTKQTILEAAEKNHYNFNFQARALRSQKTNKILCCIPDICNPFYFNMIKGITEKLSEEEYLLILYPTDKSLDKEIDAINLTKSKFCDGLIMISFDFCQKNIRAIRESGVPAVLGNRTPLQKSKDNFDYIYVDHEEGMKIATDHLLDSGCRHILLVTGDLKEQTSKERSLGYLASLKNHGIEADSRYLINGAYERDKSEKALAEFVQTGLPVDGVIAGNDLSAIGLLDGFYKLGKKIPQDVKLVSFDNTDYATIAHPSFTSIDMCQYELGRDLAATLLERIAGRSIVKNTILKPSLVKRESA